MAASGLVRPGTYGFDVYERDGLFPWSPPATGEEIEAARMRLPGLPEEVIELYRVSANVVAGGLEFKRSIDGITAYDRSLLLAEEGFGIGFSPSDHLETNRTIENDDGWVPGNGDILFLGGGFAMPTNGPHLGVVYVPGGMGYQRAAYRLSDVVACTRELYENGWYSHKDISTPPSKRAEQENYIRDLVMPTVQRWHCSPRVAALARHTEPRRPPDL